MLVHCVAWLVLAAASPADATATAASAETLRVMTFNLRYASETGKHAWPLRRPVMAALLESKQPDIIGTQEGVYQQLKDLEHDLPAYRWIGIGREGGSRGEFMAVFYRTDRLEPLEYDHFWLSDTPEAIGSATWGNRICRMVTWVRFRDRRDNRQFYVINTHFDHVSQESREKSAALIVGRLKKLSPELPVLLLGDFNVVAGDDKVYTSLVDEGPFSDAWSTADDRGEVSGTFHAFFGVLEQMPRIDWILFRGAADILHAEVVTFHREGHYPSDHFPVMATLRWRSE